MRRLHRLALTFGLLCATASHASATIQWTWSNSNGTETGTFTTDGAMDGGSAPAATYNIIDFSVTASATGLPLAAASQGAYDIDNPLASFTWDGAQATAFSRSNGLGPDSFFYVVNPPPFPQPQGLVMAANEFRIFSGESSLVDEMITPTLMPISSVPTTGHIGMMVLMAAMALLVALRLRSHQTRSA